MNNAGERLYNGLVKENPTFVLMLGMCPTLAVTTSAMNGLGMLVGQAVLALEKFAGAPIDREKAKAAALKALEENGCA